MRSKLFVPGSRPELFSKAMDSAADGVSIDLEDAVLAQHKSQARQLVQTWLGTHAHALQASAWSAKTLILRVNAMHTAHFEADLSAVVRPGVRIINLPKPYDVQQVREASAKIALAERANGVHDPIGLLLNIETPSALRQAYALAHADWRVVGLQLGLGDLFEPYAIDRRCAPAVLQAMLTVRMAAAEAGIYAYDGACADFSDASGYRAEARTARRLGFLGKSCIHPKQVAWANAIFSPSETEIAQAIAVQKAAAHAAAQGLGACVLNGRMIDPPFVQRAHNVLAQAQRLGLLHATLTEPCHCCAPSRL